MLWPSLFASTCAVTGIAVLLGPYLTQAGVPVPESAGAALIAGSYLVTALFPAGRYNTGLLLLLGAALPTQGWPVVRCLLLAVGLGLVRGAQVAYSTRGDVRRWVAVQNFGFAAGPVAYEIVRAFFGFPGMHYLLASLAAFAIATRPHPGEPTAVKPGAAGIGGSLVIVLFYFAQSQGLALYTLGDQNGLPAGLAAAAHGLAVSALVLVVPRRLLRFDLGLLAYATGFGLLACQIGRGPIAVALGLHGLGEAMVLPVLLPVLSGSGTKRWLFAALGYSAGLVSGAWRFGPTAYFGAIATGFGLAAAASLVLENGSEK